MLSVALMALGLMLGGHFEAPRELKFQGALMGESELDRAIREKPRFTPAHVVLGIGGGVTALGVVLVVAGVAAQGWDGLALAVLGIAVGAVGLVVVVVGVIVVIAIAVARSDADQRIEMLRRREAAPPPPQVDPDIPPPSVMNTPLSGLMLARF